MALTCMSTAMFSLPAVAEPIWGKVDFGMSRDQIEQLYPEGPEVDYQPRAIEISGITIIGKCQAEVNIYFDDARLVNKVMIAGDPSIGGRCSRDVMAALAAKYGEPLDRDYSFGTLASRQGRVLVWSRADGVTMQFKKYENGLWGGGGLGKASWELTYSRLGDAIDL